MLPATLKLIKAGAELGTAQPQLVIIGGGPLGPRGQWPPQIRKQFTNQELNIGFDKVYFSSLYGGCVVDHQGYKPTHLYQGKL